MEKEKENVNVASKNSTSGHFVKGAKKVVMLDEITETSFVEGSSILKTKNHTDLKMESDCLITLQQVYDPLQKMFVKVVD